MTQSEQSIQGSHGPAVESIQVTANGVEYPFFIREGYADRGVVQQIFTNEDYGFSRFRSVKWRVDACVADMAANGRIPFILDAGANIGASALFFSASYPTAVVCAIEPESDNCDVFRLNCEPGRITLLEGAVASETSQMFLSDPGKGEWAYRVGATGTVPVNAYSVKALTEQAQAQGFTPFIAKVDIEGGEAELFSQNTEWMNAYALIIVELHDWMLPREHVSQNFYRTVAGFDFDLLQRGENTFALNNSML